MDSPNRLAGHDLLRADVAAHTPPLDVAGPRPFSLTLLHAVRPRQWLKNLLVLSAPLAAGQAADPQALPAIGAAFVLFCVAASGVYLFNDVRDVAEDRRHPVKRNRPVACGDLSPRLASTLAGVLLLIAAAGAFTVTTALGAVVVLYVAVQLVYATWLKHEPVLDMACVASGFLLRAIAGGAATGIALSGWFLLVTAFGSLFVVAGKRYSEMRAIGSDVGTRPALQAYSPTYLRFVWTLAAGVTVTAYSLWAMWDLPADQLPWHAMSIVPFTLGLLRYALDVDRAVAEAPEDLVLGDRVLQGLGALWLALVVLGLGPS